MRRWGHVRAHVLRHPVRIVPLAFLAAIAIGTSLLMLPVARNAPGHAPFLTAVFTSTSAICTTGLAVNETAHYWTTFGHVIIMVLTQLGGFGIMTSATLLILLVSERLGLRGRLVLQAESAKLGVADTRRVLLGIGLIMLVTEAAITIVMGGRLWLAYGYPPGLATWYGMFHAVQAFNNSGFSLFANSVSNFADDGWVALPLALGVIVGSTGFPVLFELRTRWNRPATWSAHTRLTVWGSLILLVAGFGFVLAWEWDNPSTLGSLSLPSRMLAAFVQSVITRSGGFYTVDPGAMTDETLVFLTGLMFIGGGAASTAGGIKVTTFFLLMYVVWTEVRGERDVVLGHRRVAADTQRRALAVALIALALVAVGALVLIAETTGVRFIQALFETASAFSTAGLSIGLTQDLPSNAEAVLIVLMFVGRVGTLVAASALALNTRVRRYRYPEERVIVG